MDALLCRVRRLPGLNRLSDALLISLLYNSDSQPDRLQPGVILFHEGERTAFWYLLLSGQVELYHPTEPFKQADLLHPFIVVMQDMIADQEASDAVQWEVGEGVSSSSLPFDGAEMNGLQNGQESARQGPASSSSEPPQLIEFNHSLSCESRLKEVGELLLREMFLTAPHLIIERIFHNRKYPSCMVGSEMVSWLLDVWIGVRVGAGSFSRFHVAGMWQTLLENDVIHHVTNEQQFADKQLYYRWTGPPQTPAQLRAARLEGDEEAAEEGLSNGLFLLSTLGPDSLFRMILAKSCHERSPEELHLVYEELLHVKALAHLSTMVKRELASVIGFEAHTNAGSVVFRQGDAGTSWFIILKGSVDVSIHGKGVVCTLREGDDFGKLALLNDAPRAATITLAEQTAHFLRVDKHHFNRILRDVEANTVRLKEHGVDVLVLERMSMPGGAAGPAATASHSSSYSVMAGLAVKMLEYVMETRIDAAEEDARELELTLQDLLLTHSIYMPTNILCNTLKQYYMRQTIVSFFDGSSSLDQWFSQTSTPPAAQLEDLLTAKRRVVTFVALWVRTRGIHFFLDPIANAFIEELFCCVLEDSSRLRRMSPILSRMKGVREARDRSMLSLSRHPLVVLDSAVYRTSAPAPDPVLPIDICNQLLRLPDGSSFLLPVRVDKKAKEMCEMARPHLAGPSGSEPLLLVEIKSSGERIILSPDEVSVPTMLSLNGKLFVCSRAELDCLSVEPEEVGPCDSFSSILDFVGSSELSQQFAIFHSHLLEATSEAELISQVFGRDAFPGAIPTNLDLLLRRFNEVQLWGTSEVLLSAPSKRVHTLRKIIKIASYSKSNGDLLSMFALTLGLSHVAVSRLSQCWEKLPAKMRRCFSELESLLDPTRNHRAYRSLIGKMRPPYVPFVPLLLKDLTFIHEGNKTYFNGLVNFEKMRMIANVLRSFNECKQGGGGQIHSDHRRILESQNLIRNLRVVDSQRRLMSLSFEIEPRRRRL